VLLVFPKNLLPPVSTNPGPSVYATSADTVTVVAAVAAVVAAAVYPVTFYSILPQD